jgi:hypothetical protein
VFDVALCSNGKPVTPSFKPAYGFKINSHRYLIPGGSYGTSGSNYDVQTNLGARIMKKEEDMQGMVVISMSWPKSSGEGLPVDPVLEAERSCRFMETKKDGVYCDDKAQSVKVELSGKPYELGNSYVIPVKLEWPGAGFPNNCINRIKASCVKEEKKTEPKKASDKKAEEKKPEPKKDEKKPEKKRGLFD